MKSSIFVLIYLFSLFFPLALKGQCTSSWGIGLGPTYNSGVDGLEKGVNNTYALLQPSHTLNINGKQYGGNEGKMLLLKINQEGEIAGAWENSKGLMFGEGLAVGPNGNIYITGTIKGHVNFRNKSWSSYNGTQDAFLLKVDTNGNVLNSKFFGKSGLEAGSALSVSKDGTVYLAGHYFYNGLTIGQTNLKPKDNSHLFNPFIAKLDKDLTPVWAKQINGVSEEEIRNLKTDGKGHILIAGEFYETFQYKNQTFQAEDQELDGFILKISQNNGSVKWAKHHSGKNVERTYLLSSDQNENIYTGGHYNNYVKMGNQEMLAKGDYCSFILKYSQNGSLQWNKRICGFKATIVNDLGYLENENSLITGGYFYKLLSLNYSEDLDCPNDTCSYLMKLNADNGLLKGYKKFSGTESFYIDALDIDDRETFIGGGVKGQFSGFGGSFSSSNSAYQYFVGKYCESYTSSMKSQGNRQQNPKVYYQQKNKSLKIQNLQLNGQGTITIYDQTGKRLISKRIYPFSKPSLNIHLDKGIYIYHIYSEKRNYTGKFPVR